MKNARDTLTIVSALAFESIYLFYNLTEVRTEKKTGEKKNIGTFICLSSAHIRAGRCEREEKKVNKRQTIGEANDYFHYYYLEKIASCIRVAAPFNAIRPSLPLYSHCSFQFIPLFALEHSPRPAFVCPSIRQSLIFSFFFFVPNLFFFFYSLSLNFLFSFSFHSAAHFH